MTTRKMLFLNIGWMRKYSGLDNDNIVGGGSYVQNHGYGFEVLNFQPFKGTMYGYVQYKKSIRIERLGATESDKSIDDIMVIWVSRSPDGGAYIVGWYNNATVFRVDNPSPEGSNRKIDGRKVPYNIMARKEDCVLLSVDERVFNIPRGKKGQMGRSNVWYADTDVRGSFKENVLTYIQNRKPPRKAKKNRKARQVDPFKRSKVEKAAIEITKNHYESIGYEVFSVEKDNIGWDLEATFDKKILRLEVKGLSMDFLSVELTPNEFDKMNIHRDSYRVCVVRNALSKSPLLSVFSYSPDNDCWEDEDGGMLQITEKIGAILRQVV